MLEAFDRYENFAPKVPVHRITDGLRPVIHRFFDSSPISPSGRFIALNELPFEDRLPLPGDRGAVIVIDLETGEEVYRSETAAWDTQVGAHAQWGVSDEALLFNRIDEERWVPFGVRVNITTGEELRLTNTVYHVSADGRFNVSPDLVKITIAQAGYGVHVPPSRIYPNAGAPSDDGVFITDLETGQGRLLVSLATIGEAIAPGRFTADAGALYTFHTKWNASGSRLMVIIRWFPTGKGKSQNWLITIAADGSDIRVVVPPAVWGDGHHPNWYPQGDNIVMNLPSASGPVAKVRQIIGKIGRRLPGALRMGGVPLAFKAVMADASEPRSLSRHMGSGHPTIHPSQTFLLSDSYLNEPVAYGDGSVPLRAIDLASDRCTKVVRIDCKPAFLGPKGEYRIDPHPVWDRSGRWLVFNGIAGNTGKRGVYIADFREFTP